MIGKEKSQIANHRRSQKDDYMHDQRVIVMVALVFLLLLVIAGIVILMNYIVDTANLIG